MLDLYNYHNNPELLKGHDQDVLYKMFWEDFDDDDDEYKDKSQIVNDLNAAYYYAIFINSRFPEGEKTIATDGFHSYYYANDILKGRFQEGETAIADDPHYSFLYATNVLKGERVPEIENTIINSKFKEPFLGYLFNLDK